MKITIDDFAKVDLRAGEIVQAEHIEGSNKLLRLKVDIGEEEPRTILSGIAKYLSPEDLIGKKCVIVVNLEPREMMGETSNGMLLGVQEGDSFHIIETNASAGGKIS